MGERRKRQKHVLSRLIDDSVFGLKYLHCLLLCQLNKLSHTNACACTLKLLLLDHLWQVLLSDMLLLKASKPSEISAGDILNVL